MSARALLAFSVVVVTAGCGRKAVDYEPTPGMVTLTDGGMVDLTDAGTPGVQCTAELEGLMRDALAAPPATESFFVELRRDSDGRVFRTNRVVSGKAPVIETTTLQAASTAKWISATVILDVITNPQLYPGAGRVGGVPLTLDSPIADFLPTSSGTAWKPHAGALASTNRLSTVTLRQLLSFTSGLEREPACILSAADPDGCISDIVDLNVAVNADGTAPRTFFYSGAHLFVAARAAVNASGFDSWGALFRHFKEAHGVFQSPLTAPAPAEFGVGAAYPWSAAGNSPNPAGAFRYVAGDYPPFLVKLLHGEILPSAVLTQLFTDETAAQGVTIKYSPVTDNGETWHYDLGNWTECPQATFTADCATLRRYSSPGSFGTYPFVDFNPSSSGDHPFVGILGYGGTTQAMSGTSIALYRSLGGGMVGVKDLAQRWAESTCP